MKDFHTYNEQQIRINAHHEAQRLFRSTREFFAELQKNVAAIRYTNPDTRAASLHTVADSLIGYSAYMAGVDVVIPAQFHAAWESLLRYLRSRGVVGQLQLFPPKELEPALYYFDLDSVFSSVHTDGDRPPYTRFSRGVSFDYDTAISKAIGECLERVPLAQYYTKDLVRASRSDFLKAGTTFLDPHDVSFFSAEQKQHSPALAYSDETLFQWVQGKDLTTGECLYIPAQLVYWNYARAQDTFFEPKLREQNTHGAGGYFTREGAVLSGLYEDIQRDGFLLYWLRGGAPPRIQIDPCIDEVILGLRNQLERFGFEVVFLDITTEIAVPSVMCCLVGRKEYLPYVVVGASSDADPASALRRSIEEACSIYQWVLRQDDTFVLPESYVPFRDATLSAKERTLLWAHQSTAPQIDFFLQGEEESLGVFMQKGRTFESEQDELAWLVSCVDVVGNVSKVFVVEATHPVLTEVGYHSVRVITPGLIPLYTIETCAPLAHPRLLYPPCGLDRTYINPLPHPLP